VGRIRRVAEELIARLIELAIERRADRRKLKTQSDVAYPAEPVAMKRRPIMLMGCTSDAGKSFLVAALCRC